MFDRKPFFEVILLENNGIFISGNLGKVNNFDRIRDGGQGVAFSRPSPTNYYPKGKISNRISISSFKLFSRFIVFIDCLPSFF